MAMTLRAVRSAQEPDCAGSRRETHAVLDAHKDDGGGSGGGDGGEVQDPIWSDQS